MMKIKSIHTMIKTQSLASFNVTDITTLKNEIKKSHLTRTMPLLPTQSELKAKGEHKKMA